jgi:hypothetical protein
VEGLSGESRGLDVLALAGCGHGFEPGVNAEGLEETS